jgi:hypothetical protein
VWPPFDAAQSDGLQIAGPDRTFTLLKQKENWSVADDKEKTVQPSAVVDTLVTLANLKAVQYVTDVKKDATIYGLTKPEWRIGVTTPGGPRELWLGSFEGASKRRYATVRDSGVVFILSEGDTAVLTRPLSAYAIDPKKK